MTIEHSSNGWTARETMDTIPLKLDTGVEFIGGVRRSLDVHDVLLYVVQQVNDRVEKAINPGCWGRSYRPNKNDPNELSNHASGTALDYNAPQHPNSVPTASTWTPGQVKEIHKILEEVDHAVRWGGDYTRTPDSMHFEINVDAATLHEVAEKLREDMAFTDADRKLLQDIRKEQLRGNRAIGLMLRKLLKKLGVK